MFSLLISGSKIAVRQFYLTVSTHLSLINYLLTNLKINPEKFEFSNPKTFIISSKF